MAATDQTFRNQKTLDTVFGVSCVLMLLSLVWMFYADYHREYKSVQREFRDVEEALNEQTMLDKLPNPKEVAEKREEVDYARKSLRYYQKKALPEERRLMVERDIRDNKYRSIKADYDAKMSYLNIALEHRGKAPSDSARKALDKEVDDRQKELDQLQKELAAAQDALDATDREFKEKVRSLLDGPEQALAQAEDDLKKLTAPFDRYAKLTAQKSWKFGDTFRTLPILDGFESPTKIKQVWLPDLTIDYGGFKDVPRYDRCVSCHLGIDRGSFDRSTLVRLGSDENHAAQEQKLLDAEKILREREASGEKLGYDPGDLPTQRKGPIWGPVAILFASFLMVAFLFGMVEKSVRAAVAVTAVGGAVSLATAAIIGIWAPRTPAVKSVKLTPGQVTEYCAHPRMDLFVDANSPHPMEKFGCTSCHAGQGSATDFLMAAHTPAEVEQQEHWIKENHWEPSHNWDFPMLSKRFTESSCLKCHHQVTDLVRHGSKEEAPKLLRGYNLIRENGCFGCHEIAGIKAGREVGPDLRLEPSPALEYLTPAEQDRAKSDPLNPPGTYRKVGPSLRRITEKTNAEWTRKWLLSPRGFRPDTKMPHFYGLSTNSPDVLPETQKKFPDTEIHSIAHYLFSESKKGLEGKDTTRAYLEARLTKLNEMLQKQILDERNRKEQIEVTRRLTDLGLLSAPMHSAEINAAAGALRAVQDRVQELYRKQNELQPRNEALSAADKKELDEGKKSLAEVTARLVAAGKPTPIAAQLVGENGAVVAAPKAAGNAAKGRLLFTEKGCLACHANGATEKAGDGFKAVVSEANFGPNLSRIAAKITPEGGPDAGRLWLTQWVMNPNVYHPRTRMPITHLSAEEAGDVAAWLLAQKSDWTEADPKAPSSDDLAALARIYLAKAPGMTRTDVENFLPATGDRPGIPDERLAYLVPDADEQKLSGPLTDDKLKWYIGRKSINRMGCFGCHDVPGFETAKPIGTALNDWGKKDPERLAFEDADLFVKRSYHIVPERADPANPNKPAEDWHAKDGKEPYDKMSYETLEHHHREGFLNLKLMEPRSFDYNRPRLAWEDRLRMPQFRFARSHRKDKESAEDYAARQEFEEAEAREAVMTFVLGLVADPVPLKYLNTMNADRLAEVKGRQVLEKFNCAGCHQVRPGVYEFKPTEDAVKQLEGAYKAAAAGLRDDYHFPGHNAWTGTAPASPDRLLAFGTLRKEEEIDDRKLDTVRLTDALRFTGNDGVVRDLPAASLARLVPGAYQEWPAYGGTFTELMTDYLTRQDPSKFKPTDPDNQTARSVLPPPLYREGERVQPNWLYGFLLNPGEIRPPEYMKLRMPKFNMSPEDARQLVDYFTGVTRQTNPGAGVSAQYLTIDQREPGFWKHHTQEYVQRLEKAKLLDGRVKEMDPVWELYVKQRVAESEAGLDAAKQAVKDAPEGDARKIKEKELADLEGAIKTWKGWLTDKKYPELEKHWKAEGALAVDAFRTITNRELCLKCHSVGGIETTAPQGPNLALASQRLRPEWMRLWISNPARMFPYSPVMPVNFPNNPQELQSKKLPLVGTPSEVVGAVRDTLLDLPRLTDLPGMRSPGAPTPAGGGK